NVDVTWGFNDLIEMAKTSFRSCKVQWREQIDAAMAAREEITRRTNRYRTRRMTACNSYLKAVDAFAAKHKIDPASVRELLHEQYMSDEASGPEDDDETSKAVWKTKMGFKSRRVGRGDSDDEGVDYLQVLTPDWRADEMSEVLHEMVEMWFNALAPKEKKKIHYKRVRGTGRSSARIPDIAPYNFGINRAWFDTYKNDPHYGPLLANAKWDTFKDPEGFGSNKEAVGAETVET
ncbi:hypothetical protein C8J57DRAFT_984726, partial [Mycena rebaudengoi]